MANSRNLKNAPLVFTLAQAIFSPVLFINNYIPQIQEKLRKNGYPIFNPTEQAVIMTQFGGAGPEMQQVQQDQIWEFKDKEGENGISLTSRSVAIYTTKYIDFQEFLKRINLVMETIHETMNPALVMRLAIRYVDLIALEDKTSFDFYLTKNVIGPFSEFKNFVYRMEAARKTDFGDLYVRCIKENDHRLLPPDLFAAPLQVTRKLKENETFCFLDFDHIHQSQRDFVPADISRLMDELHKETSSEFERLTTPEAREKWDK